MGRMYVWWERDMVGSVNISNKGIKFAFLWSLTPHHAMPMKLEESFLFFDSPSYCWRVVKTEERWAGDRRSSSGEGQQGILFGASPMIRVSACRARDSRYLDDRLIARLSVGSRICVSYLCC